jgi:YbgC/YbaW family acyl-CoA thioester hydrolase
MNTKTYQSKLHVRGYELDSFGHVNHAVYVQYLEHARWEMLAAEGVTPANFVEWKRWPVIHRIEMDYVRPTFMGNELEILTQLADYGRIQLIFAQSILHQGVVVAKGRVRVVIVNELGKPCLMPAEISRIFGTEEARTTPLERVTPDA